MLLVGWVDGWVGGWVVCQFVGWSVGWLVGLLARRLGVFCFSAAHAHSCVSRYTGSNAPLHEFAE